MRALHLNPWNSSPKPVVINIFGNGEEKYHVKKKPSLSSRATRAPKNCVPRPYPSTKNFDPIDFGSTYSEGRYYLRYPTPSNDQQHFVPPRNRFQDAGLYAKLLTSPKMYIKPPIQYQVNPRTNPYDPSSHLMMSTSKDNFSENPSSSSWSWEKDSHLESSSCAAMKSQQKPETLPPIPAAEYRSPRGNSIPLKYPFKLYTDESEEPAPPPYPRSGNYINVLQRRNLVPSHEVNELIPSNLFGVNTELGALPPPPPLTIPFQQRVDPVFNVDKMKLLLLKTLYEQEQNNEYAWSSHVDYQNALKRRNARLAPVGYDAQRIITRLAVEDGMIFCPTPDRPAPEKNSFAAMPKVTLNVGKETWKMQMRRRWYTDAPGFADHHIAFGIREADRVLIMQGCRPATGKKPEKTFEEKIELPKGMFIEDLKVVRDHIIGTIIIEEVSQEEE